jgi:hypothetical protein
VKALETKKRTTLADLDARCTPRRPPAVRGRGFSGDVQAQIDMLRGRSPQARRRGIAALLPRRDRTSPALASVHAFDAGAPVRVSGAYSGAFSASLSSEPETWPSLAYATDEDQATAAFAVEVFEAEAPPPAPSAPGRAAATEAPIAAAFSRGYEEDGMLGLDLSSAAAASDREESDQFERQIQAILSGQTTRPAAQSAQAPSPVPAVVPAPDAPRPHDVFEQMGQNMSYATAFHLPPMELGRRLDHLEQEIARDEAAGQHNPPREFSLDLTDEEIAKSLGLAAPAAVVATSPATPPAPLEAELLPALPPPVVADAAAAPDNGRSQS